MGQCSKNWYHLVMRINWSNKFQTIDNKMIQFYVIKEERRKIVVQLMQEISLNEKKRKWGQNYCHTI